MADLVTSESRRYLHGIQKTVITDDDTGVALNEVPEDNQLALVDELEVLGTLTVYGDVYVTASKNADSFAGVSHNGISGRDVYAAHPATALSFTPTGGVAATNVQAAIAELDSEKEATLTYARIISVLGFTPLSTCGYGYCYGLKYGGRNI